MASSRIEKTKLARNMPSPCGSGRLFAAAASLFLIAFLAYLPSLRGGFIWDDESYVQLNPSLRTFHGLWNIWTHTSATPQYYPLVHTTFWIEYHLWGAGDDAAVGYKIVNLLLHATSAVLLWRLLRGLKLPGAWLAAAIFAVHPVNVESVAWITERKNVLAGVFYLLAFGKYLQAADEAEEIPSLRSTGFDFLSRAYLLAFLFFLLALFSKTVTATLPAAVLLVIWWKHGRLRWRDVFPMIPFFLVGVIMGSVTGYLERTQIGAHGPEWSSLTPIDRVLIAGRAIWFYSAKLVLPVHLSFIYPRWLIDAHEPLQYAGIIGVIAVVLVLWWFRRRIGRGLVTAILFFIGTLFPALGFVNVYPMRYSFVADHFQYHAAVGLMCLFAAGFMKWIVAPRKRVVIGGIVILTLCALSFERGFAYRDRESLWRDTLLKNPRSWMVHTNLAHALHQKGKDSEADMEYLQAVKLAPGLPETHLGEAIALARRGDVNGAIRECEQALRMDPQYASGYANLANIYLTQKDPVRAEKSARQAVAIMPEFFIGHLMLGRALEQEKQFPQAAYEYMQALNINSEDAETHFHLADVLVNLNQNEAAIEHYQTSLEIASENAPAWTTLGNLLLVKGKVEEAANCFKRALEIDPDLLPARQGLQRISGMKSQ